MPNARRGTHRLCLREDLPRLGGFPTSIIHSALRSFNLLLSVGAPLPTLYNTQLYAPSGKKGLVLSYDEARERLVVQVDGMAPSVAVRWENVEELPPTDVAPRTTEPPEATTLPPRHQLPTKPLEVPTIDIPFTQTMPSVRP